MTDEIIHIEQNWNITYHHTAGEVASRFFTELRDNRKLMGKKCPVCHRVLLPARSFCDRCYVPTTDWVPVGNRGVIETFTIVANQFAGLPAPPYALVYVRLDGADTAIANELRRVNLSDPDSAALEMRIGTPVVVRFKDQRQGRVTDFWFEPAGPGKEK